MRDGEVTLAYPGESVTVGLADSEATFLAPLDLGDVAIEAADAPRPRGDGVSFGTDYFGGRTITLDLGIVRPSESEALDALSRLRRAWRADAIRLTPGATASLTFRRAGRERVVFGRPRRFAPGLEDIGQGMATVLADFAATDDLFYSTTTTRLLVPFAPAPTGGLMAPLASPLATTGDSDRSMALTVAGEMPSWPRVTIAGPVVNPVVELVGLWRLEVRASLLEGDSLVIDTAPWARTVLRNGAGAAGLFSRASVRLSKAAIPPGTYEAVLRGSSVTGSASALIEWRDTYSSL